MIGYIKGIVEEIFEDFILLDKDGIGFRIFIPSLFRNEIDYGEKVKIYTHMNVKEDSITLFGFKTREDLEVYRLLLTVNSVGPKAAMNILSMMSAKELKMAVMANDANAISKAQGIGKKTAQKILLELKDKFDFEEAIDTVLGGGDLNIDNNAVSDTVEALIALGYSGSLSLKAAKKAAEVTGSSDSGVLLKEALKYTF